MIVVFDTTETFGDLFLSGPNFKLLGSYLSRNPSKLVVPRIVAEETVNHYREHLEKHLRDARSSLAELRKFVPSFAELPKVDIESAVGEFREQFESQVKKFGGRQVGYESLQIADIVERALKRRKPFDGKGQKGFRDVVLWETVLREIVKTEGDGVQVALITSNSKDFGKDGVLAEELREDCESVGSSPDCVKLFNGLQEFVDSEVKPHLEKLDRIQEQIQEGNYKEFSPVEFFREWHDIIKDEVRDHVRRCEFDHITRWVLGEFHSHDLRSLDDNGAEYEAVDVWNVDDDQMAVGIDFSVNAEIECMEQKGEYCPDGDKVFLEVFSEKFVGDAALKIMMTVILKKDSGEVEEWEVNDLEIDLGTRWPVAFPTDRGRQD